MSAVTPAVTIGERMAILQQSRHKKQPVLGPWQFLQVLERRSGMALFDQVFHAPDEEGGDD
jgi:hypothetical protein